VAKREAAKPAEVEAEPRKASSAEAKTASRKIEVKVEREKYKDVEDEEAR
jgi:hypothetical protein